MKNITTQSEINEAFAKFSPGSTGAFATCRVLDQSDRQEWAEPGKIDGAPAKVYYIFENSEAEVEDGADMPFDAAHVSRIEIAESEEESL